ncbi:GNAT family N-acetyltransferase [Lyngbya confervoides]|uniref:GNAT family N-acetyltransferase n=1 Tax=Lyngbya confervoides BDU141951 TaxID=1574623 RepID=A0ABD4T185_9CYAN|nr:GNAT family N-acetyltransferase [Lyngbya confervoides]MCM1982198.1 GNAT family N-acetyltransferase [Lyngbya confervoides BDU141951]
MTSTLHILALPREFAAAAADLDRQTLGGFWTLGAYQQEMQRSSAVLLGLVAPLSAPLSKTVPRAGHFGLLGMVCGWHILDEVHLTMLAVHPDYRTLGWGGGLLNRLLYHTSQRQGTRATLEVRSSNQAAIGLYEQYGFKAVGERPHYYPDGESASIFWLSGLHTPARRQVLTDRWRNLQSRVAREQHRLLTYVD